MTVDNNYKQRTYLDPTCGTIQLKLNDPIDNLLSRIIDTKEFQRLRRIRQMGLGWMTFHGAEHSRFGHSVGTLFTAKKIISHLSNNFPEINLFKAEILVSSLLHDIGHGPFSHASEKISRHNHEEWTKKIITGNTEINSLLTDFDKKLTPNVIKVFEYKHDYLFPSQIISSYIDADRLDYLHRDSYYVGVPYGLTGSDRIIASFEIEEETKRLVISESIGLDAVIHYLQARHSMYQQVYQHKKNIACDFLLRKIANRIREVKPKNISKSLANYLQINNQDTDIDSYLKTDDCLLISNLANLREDSTSDKILSDLSNRFLSRKIFKSLEFRQKIPKEKIDELLEKIITIAKKKAINPDYYIGIEKSSSKPYEPYAETKKQTSKAILIKQKNGDVKELSCISGLVKALREENIMKTCLVFTSELEEEITNLKGFQELFK